MLKNWKFKRTAEVLFIASFLGLVDMAYLTEAHYSGSALVCAAISKCNLVTTSAFSSILGVPVVLLGLAFYLAILSGLAFYFFNEKRRPVLIALAATSGLASLFSLYLIYIQATELRAFCQYCLLSDALTFVIFYLLARQLRQKEESFPQMEDAIME